MSRYPFNPDWVVCPGETLQEWFDETRVPKSVATKLYGIPEDTLERILAGEEKLNLELAMKLSSLTHVPTYFWLRLEHMYRVGLAAGLSHAHD